jgi:peptidylprolyl isomerase
VSTRNRNKRVQNRQSRLTAFEVAQRRARRRRWEIATGGLVLALVIAIAFVVRSGGTDKKKEKKTTTKPCVALNDTLPKGAPNVPVKVGPPPSKLVKEDLKVGKGAVVKPGATVTVNYIGVSCTTGKIFDSSYKTGAPATFPLGGVIKGWTDGIPGMRIGGERLLGIPPDQAYGAQGSPPKIGPNEPLWFVVSMISIK